jgi:hypothetical protein
MMRNARWIAAALAMCMVVTGGCSDDTASTEDTTTTSTTTVEPPPPPVPTLDHAGYIQRLDEICTSPELGGTVGVPVDETSSVAEIDAQVSALGDRLDLMREPEVPADDEDAFDAVELAYDRVLATMSELSTAVESADTALAEELATELDGLRDEVNDAVAAAGVDACGL